MTALHAPARHRQSFCDEVLDSEREIEALASAPASALASVGRTVRIRFAPVTRPEAWDLVEGSWHDRFDADAMTIEVTGVGRFLIDSDGAEVVVEADPAAPDGLVDHWLVNHVLPSRLTYLGRLAVHGTAVDLGGFAVAFVGPAGAGKSTTAAAFGSRGRPVLADDCALLERRGDGWVVIPSFPGGRLCDDSLAHIATVEGVPLTPGIFKRRVAATNSPIVFSTVPAPFEAFVRPIRHDGPYAADVLSPGAATAELLTHCFRGSTSAGYAALVDRLVDVACTIPVIEVRYPPSLDRLEWLVESIDRTVREVVGRG